MTIALDALDALESESIHIFREVAGEFDRPVILFSGGKDSIVLVRLAQKAFAPARVPFPLLHVDTGHNYSEVIDFRDRLVERLGLRLHVAHVQDWIDDGRLVERPDGTRNPLQTQPLLDTIAEHGILVNPLVGEGYPSIGCAPCTAKPLPGADPRSGRWAGTGKIECGLHE